MKPDKNATKRNTIKKFNDLIGWLESNGSQAQYDKAYDGILRLYDEICSTTGMLRYL